MVKIVQRRKESQKFQRIKIVQKSKESQNFQRVKKVTGV